MKKFDNITDLGILYAARRTLFEDWERECKRLEEYPNDKNAKLCAESYWSILSELNVEILILEIKEL